MKFLREQLLWSCCFQCQKHGATESDEDNKKHDAESSHIPVDYFSKSLSVQTCGPMDKKFRINTELSYS